MRRLTAAVLIGVLVGLVGASPARADAPAALGATQWLGGQGVAVCHPSTDPVCAGEQHVGGVAGNWWQCVELAQRLYTRRGWHNGVFAGVNYAYQIFDLAPGLGMAPAASGAITSIVPGDMIVHGPGQAGDAVAGHVTVVDRVDGSTVHAVQQNPPGWTTYQWTNQRIYRNGVELRGVVHDPDNLLAAAPGTPPASSVRSVALRADFTGDGADDLLAISRRGDPAPNLIVLPSTGAWLGGAQLWAAPGNLTFDGSVPVPADLDGDGRTDLLAVQRQGDGNSAPLIYWHPSTGTSFAAPSLVGAPGLVYNHVRWTAGDFTGDGHDDLLAVSKRGDPAANLIVLLSTGGWLGGAALWSAPSETTFADTLYLAADLDGDGKTDLLAVRQQPGGTAPNLYWLRSTGGSFQAPVPVGTPSLLAEHTRWLAGDVTGDGRDDLVAISRRADPAPNLVVLPSTGTGLGAAVLWSAPGQLRFDDVFVPADLDGDDRVDLLAAHRRTDNVPDLWWVDSTGSNFAAPQLVGVPGLVYDNTRWQQ